MPGILLLISNFAIFGPLLGAIITIKKYEEKGSIKSLLKNAWNWKFDKKWLLATLVIPFVLTFLAFLLKSIISGTAMSFDLIMPLPILIVFILFAGGPIEEFGWRGYALPKMLKSMSPFIANLVLGLIWGVWHLPLHFMANTVQSQIPFVEFVLVTIEAAFIYTWIYRKTKGSLVPMITLHWFSNLASAIFLYYDTSSGRYIFFGLQLILIIVILIKEKGYWFSKNNS
jgi:membrane protease YdiL (CAAX protease family)